MRVDKDTIRWDKKLPPNGDGGREGGRVEHIDGERERQSQWSGVHNRESRSLI